jgi:hypothetical protein
VRPLAASEVKPDVNLICANYCAGWAGRRRVIACGTSLVFEVVGESFRLPLTTNV